MGTNRAGGAGIAQIMGKAGLPVRRPVKAAGLDFNQTGLPHTSPVMNMDRTPPTHSDPSDRDTLLPSIDMGDALRNFFLKLRRHWRMLAGFLAAAVILALAYVLTATSVYTANGAILIDPRVGQAPETQAQMMPGLLQSDALTVDSELRVLTSREVTAAVVRNLGLTPEPSEGPSLSQRLAGWLGLGQAPEEGSGGPEAEATREAEALRRGFVREMNAQRSGESYVIDISYTSPDRAFAAQAVNTLMREYLRASGQQQIDTIERNRAWLESRIDELRSDVEAAETAVAEFRRSNQLLAPGGQLLPTEIALNAAVEELIRLQSREVELEVQIGQLGEQIDAGAVDAVQIPVEERTPALLGFQTRLAELQQEEQEQLLQWSEDSPIIRNARRQQEQTRALIVAEYRQIRDRLLSAQEALTRQVAATEGVIEDLRDQYGEDSRRSVDLRSLEREAEAKRQLYERLLEDYNSTSQLLTFDATSARVIAWAVPPDVKSAPKSKQVLVLAVFAALVLGVGVIFLMEALDNSFRRPSEVTRALDVPFVGVVPAFGSEKTAGLLGGDRTRGEGNWRSLSKAARRLGFAALNPGSIAADTMRMLHAQLAMQRDGILGAGDRSRGLVVGFTSSTHSEGKTTTAANFASFLASRQERVALVDLDLVTRELSRLMAPVLPAGNTLSAVLEDPEAAIEGLQPVDEFPGLAVIGNAGEDAPRTVTPRNVERLETALRGLCAHFDYVVVDLPPAQGTADTQLLGPLCDCLLYAIRWGDTPRDRALSALRQRGIDRAQIFGALFTRAPLRKYRSYNRHVADEYYG